MAAQSDSTLTSGVSSVTGPRCLYIPDEGPRVRCAGAFVVSHHQTPRRRTAHPTPTSTISVDETPGTTRASGRARVVWSTSDRSARLPPGWPTIRAAVSARAGGRCEARHHEPTCDGRGTDADHISAGDDHSMGNLQWLSGPCHRAKTARETAERNRARAAAKKRTERHPGAMT
jgi:5-methylcytosine-specific restriction enzyme A